jgi:hypothetical protein
MGLLSFFSKKNVVVLTEEQVKVLDVPLGPADKAIRYKDPKVQMLLSVLQAYEPGKYAVGTLVKTKNNAVAQVVDLPSGHRGLLFVSPYSIDMNAIAELGDLGKHQALMKVHWPATADAAFNTKLQTAFKEANISLSESVSSPKTCFEKADITLKWYQEFASTYIVYGPYRGLLLFHEMGSGKTCTAIAMIDKFNIRKNALDGAPSISPSPVTGGRAAAKDGKAAGKARVAPQCFVVLPPMKSLEENFRKELGRCPSGIRTAIKEAGKRTFKADASSIVNRIINKNVTIISYVSLSHKLKSGALSIENSMLIMDEAHNFLVPLRQYKKDYDYLFQRVRATKSVKLVLMTGTPIMGDLGDLTKLVNLLRPDTVPALPQNRKEFMAKYFVGDQFRTPLLQRDLQGYVSYYSAEGDLNMFAGKQIMAPTVPEVSDDHYLKVADAEKADVKRYSPLTLPDLNDTWKLQNNDGFKNKNSGYLKHASAVTNLPQAYKQRHAYPDKFDKLLANLNAIKGKQLVWSRHTAYGANAVGIFLASKGWQRMSSNRADHGTNPPHDGSDLAKQMAKYRDSEGELKGKAPPPAPQDPASVAAWTALVRKSIRDPARTFIVLNKDTSVREVKNTLNMYNDLMQIKVVIVDDSFSEGTSLKNTVAVHLFDQPPEVQKRRQIIARAVRLCSHKDLGFPFPKVQVFDYVAGHHEDKTADGLLANYSRDSGKVLQQVIDTAIAASLEARIDVPKALAEKPKLKTWQWIANKLLHRQIYT